MELDLRPATAADLDAIVEMTVAVRRQLARWAPVYFNPREGADEGHRAFLGFMVSSHDHRTTVMVDGDQRVVGFFVIVAQQDHRWVDDLCLSRPELWPNAARLLVANVEPPFVTCVSPSDRDQTAALMAAGLVPRSTYHALSLDRDGGRASTGQEPPSVTEQPVMADLGPPHPPPHTFGGRPFSADQPGALVLTDGDGADDGSGAGGRVIGSPSASPPIFDPGGPTCVIDQVVGEDRAALLQQAMAAAGARGDAQLVVVTGREDQQLTTVVHDLGFRPVITLFGTPPPTGGDTVRT